jgi:hypothetical protein
MLTLTQELIFFETLVGMPPKQHQFFLDVAAKLPKFLPTPAQKVEWLGTEGDSGAGLTLHHHSLDQYGNHRKVQQHYILPHASKQHQFSNTTIEKCVRKPTVNQIQNLLSV